MHLNIDRMYLQLGRRLSPLWAMLVALCCVAVDTAAATPPAVTIAEQDSGKTIELVVGQKLAVQLPSNPTTGYQWIVLGDPAPLKRIGSDYAASPQAAGRMGAGGTQTLRFSASGSGKAELNLGYHRPWEKDVAPAKTFSVTIVVK